MGGGRCIGASLVVVVVAFATTGCEANPERTTPPQAIRVDSGGVEIVLNPIAAEQVPVFAVIDSVPRLRLGALDGRPEEQFGSIVDAQPFGDGGVAVLDGQAAEVRLFDSAGTYRATVGSRGDGPGELRSPMSLAVLPGDTLAVYDAASRRITRFGPDGALGRIVTLEETGTRVLMTTFRGDGGIVGQSRWSAPGPMPLPGPDPTFVRDTAVLIGFSPEGAIEDTIDVVPGREAIQHIEIGERSISVSKRAPVFGRTNLFAVHPDGVWSAENDRFELRLRAEGSGALIRIVRAPGLESPTSDHLAALIRDEALAAAETPTERRRAETWYALSPRPVTQPGYDRIVVGDQARLWLRAWVPFGRPSRWWVFARSGDLLGYVDVPNGAMITAVRCGSVWGIERDDLDVSYVVKYAARGLDCPQTR